MTRFAGYAAVFDAADRGGDVVRRGAFRVRGAVPLLWQHGGAPVGKVEWLAEDSRGLRVIGRVEDAGLAEAVARGAVTGLSFGYRVQAARAGRVRELLQVELVEVSLVARPMQPLARVHAVEACMPEVDVQSTDNRGATEPRHRGAGLT
ncbi:HK97 family phage prohead protease [Sphingomonas sp.]|uniref:HK97 family phage prohead protease n=1 Tax=Sphingomonas sp. TaxID=28214 RepID=UPI001B1AD199|nr:HK97 family phage prohead protease [Sphingomonas sp.]MBO9715068.1 HK97 family phage prohead protease [Sphingomonas sp.]